jgi:putative phosphoribosyl transferase
MGTTRILSHSSEPFVDRIEAGWRLAHELDDLRGRNAVVLGIPRGGVIIAWELASALDAELDIVLSRKLGAPGNPELAIGAIAEDGKVFLDDRVVALLRVPATYIERERERQVAEITRRSVRFRAARPQVALTGRTVIVTDDGLATGATMQAALWAARQERPERLICAVPVGPGDTIARLAPHADELICLRVPPVFIAVGQFYARFDQTDDEEVLEILSKARAERRVPA